MSYRQKVPNKNSTRVNPLELGRKQLAEEQKNKKVHLSELKRQDMKNTVKDYIMESLMFFNEDVSVSEEVDKIVESLITEHLDIKATYENNMEDLISVCENYRDDLFAKNNVNELKLIAESKNNFVKAIVKEHLKEANKEDSDKTSFVLEVFSIQKQDTLMEGTESNDDVLENEEMLRKSVSQTRTMLMLENLGLIFKKDTSPKKLTEDVITPILNIAI